MLPVPDSRPAGMGALFPWETGRADALRGAPPNLSPCSDLRPACQETGQLGQRNLGHADPSPASALPTSLGAKRSQETLHADRGRARGPGSAEESAG